MGNENMEALQVRRLNESDLKSIRSLDELSGFDVEFFVDGHDEAMAWGLFKGEELIGYTSLGYADCCPLPIEQDEHHTNDSLLLSDIYILQSERGKGRSTVLVETTLKEGNESGESVYIQPISSGLVPLYKNLGFVPLDEEGYCMRYFA